jgi:methanesulfonate monooxygenase small subunit
VAYSPEIRKEMTWLEHDRAGLLALFDLLPRHHVNHAPWHRHAVVYQVIQDEDGSVRTVSSLVVHQTLQDVGDTHVDGGSTNVFAVGRYHDRFRVEQGRFLLTERTVRLETRQLGVGSHLIV